jgi:hypothetical protein
MSYTTTRRCFLLTSAIGARLSAQERDKTLVSPRIIASAVANQGDAETTLHVALAKFELPRNGQIIWRNGMKGITTNIGIPGDIACWAFLLVKSPTASLTPRGRVMSVVLQPENPLMPIFWAIDFTVDTIERQYLFALLQFNTSRLEVSIFNSTGLDAFPYPLSFAPTYRSPWPAEPPSLPKLSRKVNLRLDKTTRLSLACLRKNLIVTVSHEEEGLLIFSYDRALRTWSDLPNAKAAKLP